MAKKDEEQGTVGTQVESLKEMCLQWRGYFSSL